MVRGGNPAASSKDSPLSPPHHPMEPLLWAACSVAGIFYIGLAVALIK